MTTQKQRVLFVYPVCVTTLAVTTDHLMTRLALSTGKFYEGNPLVAIDDGKSLDTPLVLSLEATAVLVAAVLGYCLWKTDKKTASYASFRQLEKAHRWWIAGVAALAGIMFAMWGVVIFNALIIVNVELQWPLLSLFVDWDSFWFGALPRATCIALTLVIPWYKWVFWHYLTPEGKADKPFYQWLFRDKPPFTRLRW